MAIALLDETVVGVALPTIRTDLEMSPLAAHWIVNAYLLALAALVAAGGRLGDLIGLRNVFVGGAVLFGVASVGTGLAQSGDWIVASRAIQGVGAAGMWSTGLAITGTAFPPEQRGRAFSYYAFGGTAALCVGPFVGGVLVQAASWRWIFFLNVPIVAAVVAAILSAWRQPARGRKEVYDLPGLALLLTILVPLVIALMQAPSWGWSSIEVVALLAVALLATPLFVWRELGASAPLLDLRLLGHPTVVASNAVLGAAQFTKVAVIVFGALLLQDQLGFSPLEAGGALLAATAAVVISVVPSGRLTDSRGSRVPTLIGIAGMVLALAWLAATVGGQSYPLLLPGLILWGASLPFFFTPPRAATMNATPDEKHGQAAGLMTTSQMVGGSLGIGVLGTILIDSGSYAAIFGAAAAIAALAWVVCFRFMQRSPHEQHLSVPPMSWAHSLVPHPALLGRAVRRHGDGTSA